MAERRSSSRWGHFLMMLPFFLIGIAIPVYFYGFSGDGPSAGPTSAFESQSRRSGPSRDSGIVRATRDAFDAPSRGYRDRGGSPLLIKLGVLAGLFVVGFVVVRILLQVLTSAIGTVGNFLVHKAAGPMFMGFLSVGSTWGIHETVFQEFGLAWAAATIAITAAIATLFALAGVRVR